MTSPKANPALVIKSGILDGRALSADEVRQLADLESREVLLAKLAGAMKASLTQAVYLFAAPLSQAARVLDALRQKVAENAPEVPAEDPTVTEAPAAAADDAEAAPAAEAPADAETTEG